VDDTNSTTDDMARAESQYSNESRANCHTDERENLSDEMEMDTGTLSEKKITEQHKRNLSRKELRCTIFIDVWL
jgi:hypothetical protein